MIRTIRDSKSSKGNYHQKALTNGIYPTDEGTKRIVLQWSESIEALMVQGVAKGRITRSSQSFLLKQIN